MQLSTARVDCEKAAGTAAGDPQWEDLTHRAEASLHVIRAYRERIQAAAYCGVLPVHLHHSSGIVTLYKE